MRKCRLVNLLTVFWLCLASSAYADVQMQIELGFNRHYAVDSFTPVRVLLTNGGRDGIRGLLEISQELEIAPKEIVKETHSWPVELPKGSKKMIQVTLSIGAYTDRIQITLRDEKNPKMVYQSLEIKLHEEYSPELQKLVLALSDGAFVQRLPTGESAQIIGVEQLGSDAASLAGVRRIYLGRIKSERLEAGQKQALKYWLLGGGELVVFSGDNWHRQRSPFLEGLIPMKVTDTSELHLEGNTLSIVTGEPNGVVLLQAQDAPILIERSFGAGKVLFSTINPFAVDIGGFWEKLLPKTSEEQGMQSPLEVLGRLVLPLPSVFKVSGLVIVFIAGFWFLSQLATRDKKYLWALFVWVVLLSAASAIYMSNPAFAKSLRSLETGICHNMSEEVAFCRLWYGLASRKAADLGILTTSAIAVQQLLPTKPAAHPFDARYAYGKEGLKIFMGLEDRQKRHFYLESVIRAPVTFSLKGGTAIKVNNRSDHDLFDAIFIKDGKIFRVGELPARAVTERRLTAEMPDYIGAEEENVEAQIRRTLLRLANAEDLREALLAWSRQAELSTHPHEEKTVIKLIIIGR